MSCRVRVRRTSEVGMPILMGGLGEDLRRAATERLKYLVEGLLVRFGPETPILAAVPRK